jgi:hypothetical protein
VWELLFWFETTISKIKTKIFLVSIFLHGNHNLQMLAPISECMKGYYLFLSIIKHGQMQQGRETVVKLLCAGTTIMNRTDWW